MNTRSTRIFSIGMPGSRPMYSSIRCALARSEPLDGRSGTRPVIGTTMPGFVPQVTNGARSEALISMTLSYFALGSEVSVRQRATIESHSEPLGAKRGPFLYANV